MDTARCLPATLPLARSILNGRRPLVKQWKECLGTTQPWPQLQRSISVSGEPLDAGSRQVGQNQLRWGGSDMKFAIDAQAPA